MCGICGVVDLSPDARVDPEILGAMNLALAHRGPDDEGTFIDNDVGLGARRLSIIDVEGGHQPVHNQDRSVWIVHNGEIYNHRELRERHASYAFRTGSDCEVILPLYRERGPELLDDLSGIFAFVLYDRRSGDWLVARDPIGVMPLYHTMGVRSLLAMALIDGCFVCQPRFDAGDALALIARERLTNLFLVPTLFHDLLEHPDFAATDVSSVRKLGFAGMAMTDGLLGRLAAAFQPDLFVNHYGSSEIYTFTIEDDAPARPGSAGKAGINQRIRVVELDADDADATAAVGEEGEIIADLISDEAFEGYWRRPDADGAGERDRRHPAARRPGARVRRDNGQAAPLRLVRRRRLAL